ncbi:retrovirus-related pol polyprotein from transposon TNT 1-94 [Tanacetum coccineum]
MTGNKCYLTEYDDYNGGFVSFGDGKGRISRKGKIKTETLDFDNVYFCKELKYNLFSVSQICDKKNNVLFTNTECLVLSSDFKLLDKSQVLLRVPRKDNIYSVDLKSDVPTKVDFLSVARTPQQNGVAERRNRTLIEAARTMLVDSKLPTTFWTEAVNIAFYVLNRCPVTILNTRDHLGKFDGKADEGFFVGYFVVSKAMRVFNKRTRIVEGTLNIRFLENTPNVTGNRPDWLFDVNSLTISMNCVPVVAETQTNGIAGTRDSIVIGQAEKKTEHEQELLQQEKQTVHPTSTNSINTVSTPVSTNGPSCTDDDLSSPVNAAEASNAFEEHLFEQFSPFKNAFTLPPVSNMTPMDNTGIFGNAYDDEDVCAKADLNNMETTMNVSPIPTTRIDKDHIKDQIIRDFNSAIQTRKMTKISDEHAMFSYIRMDDPNMTIEEYIKLEKEKARRRDNVYNWETATYGKIWYDKGIHDLISLETEFPVIVFNNTLTSKATLSC